jgi:adenylate cyclase, class 2
MLACARLWQLPMSDAARIASTLLSPRAVLGLRLFYTGPMSRHATSNREIEIKLRVSDVPALLKRLRLLGASCHGRVFEQNTLYDTPQSDLRRRVRLLRVRIETPAPTVLVRAGAMNAVLTSKAPVGPPDGRGWSRRYKEKLESEVPILHPKQLIRTLGSIGFRATFRYDKYRSSFRFRGLHLDLDETPVGVFLELEGTPGGIDRTARALGFSFRDYIRASYWDLYAADCRRRGRKPRNMLFRA